MSDAVLALNAGSSTLKYGLFRCDEQGETELASATLAADGGAHAGLLDVVVEQVRAASDSEPTVVGHRLVHGGPHFTAPTLIDDAVLAQLEQLTSLAPLHLPPALALLRAARARCPGALHVACFDTAFHANLPDVARRFALPQELYRAGLRRYGFHGLSFEYVLSALGKPPPERLVVAHLGSGASLAAILRGRCIDTSMGLTPAGGIPMGSRTGDLDPGVLIRLMRERGYDADDLEQLVNHRAGLLGLAGSTDVGEMVKRAGAGDAEARFALEFFAYAVKKQIGAYAAALCGLDCLVFTAGIGEHAPLVRELSCGGLQHLGIELDPVLNDQGAHVISRHSSPCQVRVVATDEGRAIARAARKVARSLRA